LGFEHDEALTLGRVVAGGESGGKRTFLNWFDANFFKP
jgi:hypothetical protein